MMTSKTVKLQTNKNLNPPSAMISPQCDPECLDISIHSVDCSVVIWCRNPERGFHLLILLELCTVFSWFYKIFNFLKTAIYFVIFVSKQSLVTKSRFFTKLGVTKSRLHCTAI